MKPFAFEFRYQPGLSSLERLYIQVFTNPVLGLRLRARSILPLLAAIANHSRDGVSDIWDWGCGRGMFSFYLGRLFPQACVTGFDFDNHIVEANQRIARQCRYSNLHFQQRDITACSQENACDLLLSTDCLEHIVDDSKQVERMARALRPGGYLVVHVPHITRNLFGWKRENFMGIEGHVRPGYTKSGLIKMAESVGLTCEECFYTYGYFETLANDLAYLITGGREKSRLLYALSFPILLLLSFPDKWRKRITHQGSGLIMKAVKPL